MQINKYVEEAKRTMAVMDSSVLDNVHMLLGMVTEVGELADVYKKNIAYKKPVDYINVKEEIGDVMWYIANFCSLNNFDLEEILKNNIAKLRSRYPEKFTEQHATNRNLEKERDILTNGF